MRLLGGYFGLLLLAGCQSAPSNSVTVTPGLQAPPGLPLFEKVQAFYGILKQDASDWVLLHPNDAPAIAKAEALLDPEIAALSVDTAPTNLAAVVGDIANHIRMLPPGLVPPAQVLMWDGVATAADGMLIMQGPRT